MTRTIRTLDLAEIATLLDWAAIEGWNPGIGDAAAFQAADPVGFLGAFVDGVMVAGISAVAYDSYFGFIGLYICHPAWRGQGHGKAIWDAAMAYLGDRTIGLDGVPEQQANYAAMGFVPSYETVRMSGTLLASEPPLPAADLEQIRALDRRCFPASRDGFLRHWLVPPNQSLIYPTQSEPAGYAVLRQCRVGFKLGPLFAETMDATLAILATLSADVQIDVPVAQTAWLNALIERGFTAGFRTTRMYRGPAPAIRLDHVFGIGSLELG